MKVREKAMEWLSNLANDDVCDFLPQLVQVSKCVCLREDGWGRGCEPQTSTVLVGIFCQWDIFSVMKIASW